MWRGYGTGVWVGVAFSSGDKPHGWGSFSNLPFKHKSFKGYHGVFRGFMGATGVAWPTLPDSV